MKRIFTMLTALALFAGAASAQQVWINEVLANPYGSDSTTTAGNEYFELRGTPNMSLSGYYLLSLEGQVTAPGDINQFFDLGAFSIGANGYLFARQNLSPFTPVASGATLVANTSGQGWGLAGSSTAGHSGDGTQVDLENSATTILLVNIGSGSAPTLSDDLDPLNNGSLVLPTGWTVVDSVGIMDGNGAVAGDFSYGAITLRGRVAGATEWLGTAPPGTTVIDVPGNAPSTAGAFYVARKGESAGSTADDWFGATLSTGGVMSQTFADTSDPFYQGLTFSDMVFGGPNPIPEPGTLALLGLGAIALLLRRQARSF